ncbi:ABC transporter substrate-binding protein [Paenibacillus sp. VTT E-133280]|uniref:extracellular solute-binding protein n=1 Tax=Paenibacillus sp. VTT E-133280 TaxID=1986222 RepID=UPI000BD53A98|nr:extracellular solute-binding protein [Paenibacillus sp. VTT E-133280]OZQ65193.1 ABC transporter substrate-binding protein [Paenibacillus sp. VTT E-133280]
MSKVSMGKRATLYFCLFTMLVFTFLSACNDKEFTGSGQDVARPSISILAPLHFPQQPSKEIMAEIEKLTGVKLDIRWVPEGVYTDKMNTALTTNSLGKVTFVKFSDYNLVKNAIRSDAFWEIGPYLQEFSNLKQLNPAILKQTSVDSKIYGLYTERPSSRQGVIIRKDWLDNLHLNNPQTLDELYEVMRQFTYNDPDQNGKQDTLGLVDRNDLVYGVFKTLSSYFGTPNNWKLKNHQFVPEFVTAQYKNTMNFMKKLYDEKIINQDFALTSKEVQRDKFINGIAGVFIGSMTDVQRLSIEAQNLNPKAELTLINRIKGPEGYKVWSIPNYNGLYLFSKKAIATEDELRQVLEFFDQTMDKDVANIMMYGFEGRHYKLEEGKIILPEETSELRVKEVNPLYSLMIADISNKNIMEVAQKEQLTSLADQLSKDNESFLVDDPTVSLSSSTYDEKNVELSTIIVDATYNYILGNITAEGFQKEVEKWRASGGDLIIKEYGEAELGIEK